MLLRIRASVKDMRRNTNKKSAGKKEHTRDTCMLYAYAHWFARTRLYYNTMERRKECEKEKEKEKEHEIEGYAYNTTY